MDAQALAQGMMDRFSSWARKWQERAERCAADNPELDEVSWMVGFMTAWACADGIVDSSHPEYPNYRDTLVGIACRAFAIGFEQGRRAERLAALVSDLCEEEA
jgi:hypothetical protein